MDVFRKCLLAFDILHDCVDKSCVCQLSLNEYTMMMMYLYPYLCVTRATELDTVIMAILLSMLWPFMA